MYLREWQDSSRGWFYSIMENSALTKACVTACDANFAIPTRNMLATLRRHHREVKSYVLTPPADVTAVEAILGDLAQILPIPRAIVGLPDKIQMYSARMFIPDLVGEDVAAWIDSDIILIGRVDELWDVPPGKVNVTADLGFRIGKMVGDQDDDWVRFAKVFPFFTRQDVGINSGVFAFRTAEWKDLLPRYEKALASVAFSRVTYLIDQIMLSAIFHSHARYLPSGFNAHGFFVDPSVGRPADLRLIHYAGPLKPWNDNYPRNHWSYYYWEKNILGRGRLALAGRLARIWLRAPGPFLFRVRRKLSHALGFTRD
jgi:lipopolysaccharide biosynthesis glycosyltransferase